MSHTLGKRNSLQQISTRYHNSYKWFTCTYVRPLVPRHPKCLCTMEVREKLSHNKSLKEYAKSLQRRYSGPERNTSSLVCA